MALFNTKTQKQVTVRGREPTRLEKQQETEFKQHTIHQKKQVKCKQFAQFLILIKITE